MSTAAVEDEIALATLERGASSELADHAARYLRKRLIDARALEKSRDHLLALLGLGAEIPEERPTYAPGGYAHELDRIADLLNEHECAPAHSDPDQSVFGGVQMVLATLAELIVQLSPKAPADGGAQ